jgi:NAD(P)-dependent dehydrogenase (short-subunit alcohol dehydrogenase family)
MLVELRQGGLMADKRFEGKISLVTGASSGIGQATALALTREGAKVALVARRLEILNDTASRIAAEGGTAFAVAADVTREEDRKRVMTSVVSSWGGLDIVVNAAGIIAFGTIENTTLEAWQEMFDINMVSVFRLTQLALPHLIDRKGNVVIVSSVTGTRSFPGVLAYCASKAAVDQFTRCAALELAEKGVRINAVNPGVVLSNLHRAGGLDEEAYKAFLERSKTTHPLGRVGNSEEIADLILFLASDNAGWITGATVPIDGGRNLTCAR